MVFTLINTDFYCRTNFYCHSELVSGFRGKLTGFRNKFGMTK